MKHKFGFALVFGLQWALLSVLGCSTQKENSPTIFAHPVGLTEIELNSVGCRFIKKVSKDYTENYHLECDDQDSSKGYRAQIEALEVYRRNTMKALKIKNIATTNVVRLNIKSALAAVQIAALSLKTSKLELKATDHQNGSILIEAHGSVLESNIELLKSMFKCRVIDAVIICEQVISLQQRKSYQNVLANINRSARYLMDNQTDLSFSEKLELEKISKSALALLDGVK